MTIHPVERAWTVICSISARDPFSLRRWRLHLIALCALATGVFCATPSMALELLMMEQKACPWCKRWKEEIGIVYPKTDEGKQAALRLVDIHDEWPEDLNKNLWTRFTPTFILVDKGIEIDRLYGYQGEEAFWFQLGKMLKKTDTTPKE